MLINTEPPNLQVSSGVRFLFRDPYIILFHKAGLHLGFWKKINMRKMQVNLAEVKLEFRGSVNHASPHIYLFTFNQQRFYYGGGRESEFLKITDHTGYF